MARKPYVPLTENKPCDIATEAECKPTDRFVRAMVSKLPDNSISQEPDGLYVPAIIYRENTSVIAADESIIIAEEETDEGFRRFTVGTRISDLDGNVIEVKEDGLFVEIPAGNQTYQDNLVEGSLSYSPSIPGQGIINFPDADRVFVRVVNSLIRLVLPEQPSRSRPQELYLVQDGTRNSPMKLVWEAGVIIDNVAGPAERDFAPGVAITLARMSDQNWLLLRSGGVPYDAPLDNQPYARKNGTWVQMHKEVLPALVTGRPTDIIPLEVSNSQFNRIVVVDSRYSQVNLKRQHLGLYPDHFEATYIMGRSFQMAVPMGVTVNGIPGPISWNVDSEPRGVVIKKLSVDNWLFLGSVIQDGVSVLPEITVLAFPEGGTFKGCVRMLDGTMLYDMGANATPTSNVRAIKNLIIAGVICNLKNPTLTYKSLVYSTAYAAGIVGTASGLLNGDIISYQDMLTLLLVGGYEDIAYMASSILGQELRTIDGLGANNHARFTIELNAMVASIENPKTSVIFSAAEHLASPTATATVYQINNWLQFFEENYTPVATELRKTTSSVSVFGDNARTIIITAANPMAVWASSDFGKTTKYNGETPTTFGIVEKLEMPADIPVFLTVLDAETDMKRHMAYSSAMLHLEDDFPFLSGSYTKIDNYFSNVVLLLGNTDSLIDRSNVENFVSVFPVDVVKQNRIGKGFRHAWALGGYGGSVSVVDDPSLRMNNQNFTFEIVFRGRGPKTAFTLFAKYSATDNKRSYWCRINGASLEFIYSTDGVTQTVVSVPLPVQSEFLSGARRNITIQRRGTDLEFFINGKWVQTHTIGTASLFDNDLPLNIGADGDPTSLPEPVAGQSGLFILDNFRITKSLVRYPVTGFGCETTPFKNDAGT